MRRLILAYGICFLFLGCGGPPNQEMTDAELALKDAELARKCAPDEFAAAELSYSRAQKLMDEEKYSEAKEEAIAAQKLAIHARNKALLNKDACEAAEREAAMNASKEEDERRRALEEEARRKAELEAAAAVPKDRDGLETVYFGFNLHDLSTEAREILNQNAKYLEENPSIKVTIGGHCDERGSTEYNMALGEKRALVVKKYLVSMGIAASRLQVMSFGEEELVDYGQTEAAHQRNRRADFRTR